MNRRPLAGVLIDLDGTLVDTEDLHYEAWLEAFASVGIAFDRRQFEDRFGLDSLTTVQRVVPGTREECAAIVARKEALFRRRATSIRAFPGVTDLLNCIRALKLKVALVSSTKQGDVEELLLPTLGHARVDAIICKTDLDAGRPAPDLNLRALASMSVAAEEAAAIGDTVFDIGAARAAGVRAIAVAHNGRRSGVLEQACPDWLVQNLFELRSLLERVTLRGEPGIWGPPAANGP